MSENWFFDQNFNLIEDNFFDDVNFDPSLDDVNLDQSLNNICLEGDNVSGDNWDANFQGLEPPPPMFYGDSSSAGLDENHSYGGSSPLNLLSSSWRASSSGSISLHDNSADVKDASLFQSSSPVSVLESSSSCSGPAENPPVNPKLNFPVKRTRSKRKRASTFNLQLVLPRSSCSSSGDDFGESESDGYPSEKSSMKQKRKKNLTLLAVSSETKQSESQLVVRKCLHCGVTKTPQWREGPNGPKTLCNACGVRYRSGRLVPEYRPAASPTFVPSLHSNSHRKIVEMRKKAEEIGNTAAGPHATAAA